MYLNGNNTSCNDEFPVVYITPDALYKLNAYYRIIDKVRVNSEISGLGVAQSWENDILISEVILLKQESTPGDTELDDRELSRWLTELIELEQDPSLYRLWWHKHPIDGWSSTDNNNIEKMNNNNWLVSIVHTPRGLRARLDLYSPFRAVMDDLRIVELVETDHSLDDAIKKEIEEKVSEKKYPVYKPGSYAAGMQAILKEGKKIESGIGEKKETGDAEFYENLANSDWESFWDWEPYTRKG